MKDDFVFIDHMLDSIKDAEEFSKNLSREGLGSDKLRQNALVRCIEIIGEAAKNISEEMKEKHPEIPWKRIIGTRDKMIHQYFGVDLDTVWDILESGLPDLKKKLVPIKKSLGK